jgi:rhodanese-related sulfurtransferase
MPSSLVSDKIKAGMIIVDLRTPDEFADGAYPKAMNMPESALPRAPGAPRRPASSSRRAGRNAEAILFSCALE